MKAQGKRLITIVFVLREAEGCGCKGVTKQISDVPLPALR